MRRAALGSRAFVNRPASRATARPDFLKYNEDGEGGYP